MGRIRAAADSNSGAFYRVHFARNSLASQAWNADRGWVGSGRDFLACAVLPTP